MDKTGTSHHSFASHDMKLNPAEKRSSQAESAALKGVVWRKFDRWMHKFLFARRLARTEGGEDKTSIGHARVAGLQKPFAISNYQLDSTPQYVGPDLMLPAMVTLWGVAAVTQEVANKDRCVLCVIIVIVAAVIDQINGKSGKTGWAWTFILEGIFTFVFGVISFFLLPRSPETARFLTEKERAYVVSTLEQATTCVVPRYHSLPQWCDIVWSAFVNWVCPLLPNANINDGTSFEPSIVAGLGHHQRASHVRYGSLFFSGPGHIVQPASVTWLANNNYVHVHVRRATAVAVSSTLVLGSWSPVPNYTLPTWCTCGKKIGRKPRKGKMHKEEEPEGLGDHTSIANLSTINPVARPYDKRIRRSLSLALGHWHLGVPRFPQIQLFGSQFHTRLAGEIHLPVPSVPSCTVIGDRYTEASGRDAIMMIYILTLRRTFAFETVHGPGACQ
ncbi:hypothetical protein EV363DRAFT_1553918 [Boletus edulis]|nr:hypothetical protein EV363DRAFT_1553918 [Boletus edulis]